MYHFECKQSVCTTVTTMKCKKIINLHPSRSFPGLGSSGGVVFHPARETATRSGKNITSLFTWHGARACSMVREDLGLFDLLVDTQRGQDRIVAEWRDSGRWAREVGGVS